MIRTLENFLRPYVERNPLQWVQQLPLAEFAANNTVNVSTGFTPFYLNSGEHPVVPMSLLGRVQETSNEAVNDMVDRMKVALENARVNLSAAQMHMKTYADKSRRAEAFDVGDEVVLSTRNLHSLEQHLPVKLRKRWVGPFKIAAVISPVAYRLELPPGWRVHRTFHVGNLKRFHRSSEFERGVVPPPPELVGGEVGGRQGGLSDWRTGGLALAG